jgi:dihydropteroate synthase
MWAMFSLEPALPDREKIFDRAEQSRMVSTPMYVSLGLLVLFGVIAGIDGGEQPKSREPGSLAVAIAAASQGNQILRVHDVATTRQGLAVWRAATFGAEN